MFCLQVVVTVTTPGGIQRIKEFRSQRDVPVTEWKYFGTVDTFFKLSQVYSIYNTPFKDAIIPRDRTRCLTPTTTTTTDGAGRGGVPGRDGL